MRTLDPAIAAHLAAREGREAHVLLWITARHRVTRAPVGFGFWTGDHHRGVSLGGSDRAYHGGGAVIEVDPITFKAGLGVRSQRLRLSPLQPQVELMVRGHDIRLAPAELHLWLFDPVSRVPLGAPIRLFRGRIDAAPLQTPEAGGDAVLELGLVSGAVDLTRTLSIKKSDEAQQRRSGDRFRRYGDLPGSTPVHWGEAGPGGAFTAPLSSGG